MHWKHGTADHARAAHRRQQERYAIEQRIKRKLRRAAVLRDDRQKGLAVSNGGRIAFSLLGSR